MSHKRFSISISLILLVVFLVISLSVIASLDSFWNGKDNNKPEEIKKAILNASVQCYALEGSYPPNLNYLEDHYGLVLNREKYFYHYEVFASNVMPDVEVYEK